MNKSEETREQIYAVTDAMKKEFRKAYVKEFSVPSPQAAPKTKRKRKIVRELESRGYIIERCGYGDMTWEVSHNELHPGTTACYRTLAEIDPDYPI